MIRKYITYLTLFALLLQNPSYAQNAGDPRLSIKKATKEISVDGIGNEIDWQLAEKSSSFYQNFPSDTSYSITKTEVWLTYDDNNIYVLARSPDYPGADANERHCPFSRERGPALEEEEDHQQSQRDLCRRESGSWRWPGWQPCSD